MSYLDWKVGDRVAYVGTGRVVMLPNNWRRWLPFGWGEVKLTHNLAQGEVYEISGITTHLNNYTGKDFVAIYLRGFAHKENPKVAFPAMFFRKVQPRKTDISIFEAYLHRAPSNAEREKA